MLALLQLLALRAFPTEGEFPYPWFDVLGITAFSLCGLAFAWGNERTRVLAGIFLAYLLVGWVAKLVPSALGGNVSRLLNYWALPLLALVIAVRGRRIGVTAVLALAVALAWQAAPLVRNAANAAGRAGQDGALLGAGRGVLHARAATGTATTASRSSRRGGTGSRTTSAGAGVPLVRGWFRQDDFPQNEPLYERDGQLTARSYVAWLHRMGVRFVLLPSGKLDASAQAEAVLVRAGVPGLERVFAPQGGDFAIYELEGPDADPDSRPTAPARRRSGPRACSS